jgi:hypothetical protein
MERKRTRNLDCTKIGVSHEGQHNVMSITLDYIKYYKSQRKRKITWPSRAGMVILSLTFILDLFENNIPSILSFKKWTPAVDNRLYLGHTIVKTMVSTLQQKLFQLLDLGYKSCIVQISKLFRLILTLSISHLQSVLQTFLLAIKGLLLVS